MNLSSDFTNEENCPPADEVMHQGMSFLWEKCIEPMKENLETEDLSLIALIGMSFKIIGDQAKAYEELENGLDADSNGIDFNRN